MHTEGWLQFGSYDENGARRVRIRQKQKQKRQLSVMESRRQHSTELYATLHLPPALGLTLQGQARATGKVDPGNPVGPSRQLLRWVVMKVAELPMADADP